MNDFLRWGGYVVFALLFMVLIALMIFLPEDAFLLSWMSTGTYFTVLISLIMSLAISIIGAIMNDVTLSYSLKVFLAIVLFIIGVIVGFSLCLYGGMILGVETTGQGLVMPYNGPDKLSPDGVPEYDAPNLEKDDGLKSLEELETKFLDKMLQFEKSEIEYLGYLIEVILIIEEITEYERMFGVESDILWDILDKSDNPIFREFMHDRTSSNRVDV